MELAFWILAGLVVYTYVLYPTILLGLSRVAGRLTAGETIEPSVSVVVAAFNEEKDIADKLELLLGSDYPREKMQIIVASDCSTDQTHEIVAGYADRNVQLCALTERGGKTAAQNLAVESATGEILVFTDATTEFDPDAIVKLVQAFSDQSVGCAGASLSYRSEKGSTVGRGGGLYWRYEKSIKELESRFNSLIGVSGCLYAVRRDLYRPIAPDLISDMVIALDVWSQGHITVYADEAVAYEVTHEVADKEFDMRARIVVRSVNALVCRRQLLNPFRHGIFAWQLWSHKVLRYLIPWFLLGMLVLNVLIVTTPPESTPVYDWLLWVQLAGYVLVPIAYKFCKSIGVGSRVLSAPFYFLLANAAAFWGTLQYLGGVRAVTWNTVR